MTAGPAFSHACQSGRHPDRERGLDLYETPASTVEALLAAETLPRVIWEPAAGRGAIVKVLRAHGHRVIASDVCDYGFPLQITADFLTTRSVPRSCGAILTNPPFKQRLAEKFVAHALDLAPTVVMLLRWAFYESERRTAILERRGLARMHVFRKRLPMMHRDGWEGQHARSAIPFAWFVWQRGYTVETITNRISWERQQ